MINKVCVTTSKSLELFVGKTNVISDDEEDPFLLKDDIIYVQNVIEYTLLEHNIRNSELTMVCVTAQEMQFYNKVYRGIEGVTDVLSFTACTKDGIKNAFSAKKQEYIYLGDILLCYSCVKKQAKKYRQSHMQELTRVVIHSVLHLLGYMHNTYDVLVEPMLQEQELILQKYGAMVGEF